MGNFIKEIGSFLLWMEGKNEGEQRNMMKF